MDFPLNILLFPLLAGYYFLSNFSFFKYKYQRQESQRLLLNSAIAGIIVSISIFLIRSLADKWFHFQVESVYSCINFIQLDYSFNKYLWTMIIALFATIFITHGLNYVIRNSKWRSLPINWAIDTEGDELEQLIRDSIEQGWLLQATLKNNKVYIGFVNEMSEPQKTNYLEFFPFLSGFRDSETKFLRLTTNYEIMSSILKAKGYLPSTEKMFVVIKQDEILTLSPFDPAVYAEFVNNRPSKTK